MRNARWARTLAFASASMAVTTAALAQGAVRLAGAPCETPPVMKCPEEGCVGTSLALVTEGGPVVEPKTGRNYFLDYPCDLRPGEKVTFILSLHGGGSYGNWQRHYFPVVDYKDAYRLVIATPFSPTRVWGANDDEYLQNIVTSVIEQLGRQNIRAFWLAGHSQGGLTSTRLVCTEFFRDKVDGFLSLSGGRIGGQAAVTLNAPAAPGAAGRGGAPAAGGAPAGGRGGAAGGAPGAGPGAGGPPAAGRGGAAPATGRGGAPPAAAAPDCDFSHIYETGEHELTQGFASLPRSSALAERFGCSARGQRADVVDTRGGYVHDTTRQNPPTLSWGRTPGPGRAEVFTFPNCKDGRIVADVVRMDKGHTEGLEPHVTEELVRMMAWAHGGKLQREM